MPKKPKRSYRRYIRIGGRRVTETFTRESDADRWYREKQREKELLEAGLSLPIESLPIAHYAESWLQSRKANGKPISSWQCDEARLRLYVVPRFGTASLHRVSTHVWEAFLDELVADDVVGPATRNRIRSLLSKMYNDALRRGQVFANPVIVIPKLKEAQDQWDYWHTREECEQYLKYARAEGPVYSLFANAALNTGGRCGELIALDAGDVNLEQRRLHLHRIYEEATDTIFERSKGGKPRWLGINDPLFEAFVEYQRTIKRPRGAPFISDENGKSLTQHQIRGIHDRVCRNAGVKVIRPHDLRHTYASHFVMNKGSLTELQGILGHSTPITTQRYAHLAPGFLEGKANVVCFSATAPTAGVVSLVAHRAENDH